jgi:repressor of nif and glnA expression
MGFETQDVERKLLVILRVLNDSGEPMGARIIARRLKEYGIELGERAVRYHLKLMDERGLTSLVGRRNGRMLTDQGIQEVKNALVKDKVGFAISRIELLAFRTNFNPVNRTGTIPVNISFFEKSQFRKALQVMAPSFKNGWCVSKLVAVAKEGERIGDLIIPEEKIGLATVCSIVVNGSLLKAGIPIDSKFGGLLQFQKRKPLRFVELIHYTGSSLDPSEVFIKAGMTSVREVDRKGEGTILANFREVPAACQPIVEEVKAGLEKAGMRGILIMGHRSETVCQVPVELNRFGMVLIGGLNPVAVAVESGFIVENHAMSTVVDYDELVSIEEL